MLVNGFNLVDIAKRLGHVDGTMLLKTYGHADEERQKLMAQKPIGSKIGSRGKNDGPKFSLKAIRKAA
jgi:integrase